MEDCLIQYVNEVRNKLIVIWSQCTAARSNVAWNDRILPAMLGFGASISNMLDYPFVFITTVGYIRQ